MTNIRGLVRELLVTYMNTHNTNHVCISEFKKEFQPLLPKVDVYRSVYHIGSHDFGFRIENDGVDTFVVMD